MIANNGTIMRQLKIIKSITNRESASLDKYLQEIGKEEMISAEEEVELAQRIKHGDQKHLVCRVVDPPEHPPGHLRAEPHRQAATQPGGLGE